MIRSQAVVGVCNLCAFSIIVIIITTTSLVGIAKAQNQATNPTTDPTEGLQLSLTLLTPWFGAIRL
uniref:Uncharacterized protein n=1 Tax=Rhizophora mucronata TaxID=61149 RepID=A0A2P2MWN9_RHIMU